MKHKTAQISYIMYFHEHSSQLITDKS